ncbi:MAG: type II toxin-antitoxin system HicB family antitoxin [Bacilli bacterium]|jgi:predicted RNase H-like HicB family nuclease
MDMIPMETIIIEPTPAGTFSAYTPGVQGCVATGATPEEARVRLREALAFHRAGLAEDEGA